MHSVCVEVSVVRHSSFLMHSYRRGVARILRMGVLLIEKRGCKMPDI